jgi:hypothetical protein
MGIASGIRRPSGSRAETCLVTEVLSLGKVLPSLITIHLKAIHITSIRLLWGHFALGKYRRILSGDLHDSKKECEERNQSEKPSQAFYRHTEDSTP